MSLSPTSRVKIRPVQYRDLEAIATRLSDASSIDANGSLALRQLQQAKPWFRLLKILRWFPNPLQHQFCLYVAEAEDKQLWGAIQVSPFNSSRSTWQVDWVWVHPEAPSSELAIGRKGIGSQLLRYCLETIWQARTWLLEVNINEKKTVALYRQNGFQPLAQLTYWALAPELLAELAKQEADLPNLLPVSNADAQLLYQLDTVSMPPLLRQVFDRHQQDFKTAVPSALLCRLEQWLERLKVAKGYVFEPQRKAAIGYFHLEISKDGSRAHRGELTVHPAYTWLYPKLLIQMARLTQGFAGQPLQLGSADYQPEREEYLEKLGATREEHALLMSRSVWHKLRESKPLEALQLSEVLQGLQPVRTPIPSRISRLSFDRQNQLQERPASGDKLEEKSTPDRPDS